MAAKFLSTEEGEHITEEEALAMPFRFNVVGAATPLTRAEFIAEQMEYATHLRIAILADSEAPSSLSLLASYQAQLVQGLLGSFEAACLLRSSAEARSEELTS